MRKKNRLMERMTAALVLVFFTITNHSSLGYAAAAAPPAAGIEFKNFPTDVTSIQLPDQMGRIEDAFKGNSPETIVIIQDAHSIPDAQKSIQRIIGLFQKNYGVRHVGLEGAASQLDPQIFKSFPDKKILRQVFSKYLNQGELTAGTGSAIFSEGAAGETLFEGIEDWELYEQGLGLYLASQKRAPELLKGLEARRAALEKEKAKVYPKELLELDKKIESFRRNNLDLVETLKALAAVKTPAKGTELSAFLEEIKSEKMDNSAMELEVTRIARLVGKHLETKSSSPETKKDLAAFHDKLQDFKISRISAQAFALFLKDLSARNSLGIRVSSKLLGGIENQRKMRDIEGTKFFRNFEAYINEVKQSLMRNEEQRLLDSKTHDLNLKEKLIKLELSREEWNEVKNLPEKPQGRQEIAQPDMRIFRAFYENAEKRDEAFLKNVQKNLANSAVRGPKSSLLVAGGFHAQGLTRRLKEKNVSYLLIMPQIASVPKETHYQEHMKGDVSWKSYFKNENGKINPYQAFVRSTRDQLVGKTGADSLSPESGQMLKNWRDQIIRDLAQKNQIAKAGQYTRFIDETVKGFSESQESKLKTAFQRIDRFVAGLVKLQAENKLTEPNIMGLVKPGTVVPNVTANQIVNVGMAPAVNLAVQAEINLGGTPESAAGKRNEMRGVNALPETQPYTLDELRSLGEGTPVIILNAKASSGQDAVLQNRSFVEVTDRGGNNMNLTTRIKDEKGEIVGVSTIEFDLKNYGKEGGVTVFRAEMRDEFSDDLDLPDYSDAVLPDDYAADSPTTVNSNTATVEMPAVPEAPAVPAMPESTLGAAEAARPVIKLDLSAMLKHSAKVLEEIRAGISKIAPREARNWNVFALIRDSFFAVMDGVFEKVPGTQMILRQVKKLPNDYYVFDKWSAVHSLWMISAISFMGVIASLGAYILIPAAGLMIGLSAIPALLSSVYFSWLGYQALDLIEYEDPTPELVTKEATPSILIRNLLRNNKKFKKILKEEHSFTYSTKEGERPQVFPRKSSPGIYTLKAKGKSVRIQQLYENGKPTTRFRILKPEVKKAAAPKKTAKPAAKKPAAKKAEAVKPVPAVIVPQAAVAKPAAPKPPAPKVPNAAPARPAPAPGGTKGNALFETLSALASSTDGSVFYADGIKLDRIPLLRKLGGEYVLRSAGGITEISLSAVAELTQVLEGTSAKVTVFSRDSGVQMDASVNFLTRNFINPSLRRWNYGGGDDDDEENPFLDGSFAPEADLSYQMDFSSRTVTLLKNDSVLDEQRTLLTFQVPDFIPFESDRGTEILKKLKTAINREHIFMKTPLAVERQRPASAAEALRPAETAAEFKVGGRRVINTAAEMKKIPLTIPGTDGRGIVTTVMKLADGSTVSELKFNLPGEGRRQQLVYLAGTVNRKVNVKDGENGKIVTLTATDTGEANGNETARIEVVLAINEEETPKLLQVLNEAGVLQAAGKRPEMRISLPENWSSPVEVLGNFFRFFLSGIAGYGLPSEAGGFVKQGIGRQDLPFPDKPLVGFSVVGDADTGEVHIGMALQDTKQANAVFFVHSENNLFTVEENGKATVYVRAGMIFKNGKWYFGNFKEPMPLSALTHFDLGSTVKKELKDKGVSDLNDPIVAQRLVGKASQAEFLMQHGLPLPPTIVIQENVPNEGIISQLRPFIAAHEGRIVVKADVGFHGNDIYFFDTKTVSIEEIAARIREMSGNGKVVVQTEVISGFASSTIRDIEVRILALRGKEGVWQYNPGKLASVKKIPAGATRGKRNRFVPGDADSKAIAPYYPQMLELARKFTDAVSADISNGQGIFGIDFVVDDKGKVLFREVNMLRSGGLGKAGSAVNETTWRDSAPLAQRLLDLAAQHQVIGLDRGTKTELSPARNSGLLDGLDYLNNGTGQSNQRVTFVLMSQMIALLEDTENPLPMADRQFAGYRSYVNRAQAAINIFQASDYSSEQEGRELLETALNDFTTARDLGAQGLDNQINELAAFLRNEMRGEARKPGWTPDDYRYDFGADYRGWRRVGLEESDDTARSIALLELTGERYEITVKYDSQEPEFLRGYEISIDDRETGKKRVYGKEAFPLLGNLNTILSPWSRAAEKYTQAEKFKLQSLLRLTLTAAMGIILIFAGQNLAVFVQNLKQIGITAAVVIAVYLGADYIFQLFGNNSFFRARAAKKLIQDFIKNHPGRGEMRAGDGFRFFIPPARPIFSLQQALQMLRDNPVLKLLSETDPYGINRGELYSKAETEADQKRGTNLSEDEANAWMLRRKSEVVSAFQRMYERALPATMSDPEQRQRIASELAERLAKSLGRGEMRGETASDPATVVSRFKMVLKQAAQQSGYPGLLTQKSLAEMYARIEAILGGQSLDTALPKNSPSAQEEDTRDAVIKFLNIFLGLSSQNVERKIQYDSKVLQTLLDSFETIPGADVKSPEFAGFLREYREQLKPRAYSAAEFAEELRKEYPGKAAIGGVVNSLQYIVARADLYASDPNVPAGLTDRLLNALEEVYPNENERRVKTRGFVEEVIQNLAGDSEMQGEKDETLGPGEFLREWLSQNTAHNKNPAEILRALEEIRFAQRQTNAEDMPARVDIPNPDSDPLWWEYMRGLGTALNDAGIDLTIPKTFKALQDALPKPFEGESQWLLSWLSQNNRFNYDEGMIQTTLFNIKIDRMEEQNGEVMARVDIPNPLTDAGKDWLNWKGELAQALEGQNIDLSDPKLYDALVDAVRGEMRAQEFLLNWLSQNNAFNDRPDAVRTALVHIKAKQDGTYFSRTLTNPSGLGSRGKEWMDWSSALGKALEEAQIDLTDQTQFDSLWHTAVQNWFKNWLPQNNPSSYQTPAIERALLHIQLEQSNNLLAARVPPSGLGDKGPQWESWKNTLKNALAQASIDLTNPAMFEAMSQTVRNEMRRGDPFGFQLPSQGIRLGDWLKMSNPLVQMLNETDPYGIDRNALYREAEAEVARMGEGVQGDIDANAWMLRKPLEIENAFERLYEAALPATISDPKERREIAAALVKRLRGEQRTDAVTKRILTWIEGLKKQNNENNLKQGPEETWESAVKVLEDPKSNGFDKAAILKFLSKYTASSDSEKTAFRAVFKTLLSDPEKRRRIKMAILNDEDMPDDDRNELALIINEIPQNETELEAFLDRNDPKEMGDFIAGARQMLRFEGLSAGQAAVDTLARNLKDGKLLSKAEPFSVYDALKLIEEKISGRAADLSDVDEILDALETLVPAVTPEAAPKPAEKAVAQPAAPKAAEKKPAAAPKGTATYKFTYKGRGLKGEAYQKEKDEVAAILNKAGKSIKQSLEAEGIPAGSEFEVYRNPVPGTDRVMIKLSVTVNGVRQGFDIFVNEKGVPVKLKRYSETEVVKGFSKNDFFNLMSGIYGLKKNFPKDKVITYKVIQAKGPAGLLVQLTGTESGKIVWVSIMPKSRQDGPALAIKDLEEEGTPKLRVTSQIPKTTQDYKLMLYNMTPLAKPAPAPVAAPAAESVDAETDNAVSAPASDDFAKWLAGQEPAEDAPAPAGDVTGPENPFAFLEGIENAPLTAVAPARAASEPDLTFKVNGSKVTEIRDVTIGFRKGVSFNARVLTLENGSKVTEFSFPSEDGGIIRFYLEGTADSMASLGNFNEKGRILVNFPTLNADFKEVGNLPVIFNEKDYTFRTNGVGSKGQLLSASGIRQEMRGGIPQLEQQVLEKVPAGSKDYILGLLQRAGSEITGVRNNQEDYRNFLQILIHLQNTAAGFPLDSKLNDLKSSYIPFLEMAKGSAEIPGTLLALVLSNKAIPSLGYSGTMMGLENNFGELSFLAWMRKMLPVFQTIQREFGAKDANEVFYFLYALAGHGFFNLDDNGSKGPKFNQQRLERLIPVLKRIYTAAGADGAKAISALDSVSVATSTDPFFKNDLQEFELLAELAEAAKEKTADAFILGLSQLTRDDFFAADGVNRLRALVDIAKAAKGDPAILRAVGSVYQVFPEEQRGTRPVQALAVLARAAGTEAPRIFGILEAFGMLPWQLDRLAPDADQMNAQESALYGEAVNSFGKIWDGLGIGNWLQGTAGSRTPEEMVEMFRSIPDDFVTLPKRLLEMQRAFFRRLNEQPEDDRVSIPMNRKVAAVMKETRNFYAILGINAQTPVAAIPKIVRDLQLKIHPDNHGALTDGPSFNDVTEAGNILTNPILRKIYDDTHPEFRGEMRTETDKAGALRVLETTRGLPPIRIDGRSLMKYDDIKGGIERGNIIVGENGYLRFTDEKRREMLPDSWYHGTDVDNVEKMIFDESERGYLKRGNLTRDRDYADLYGSVHHGSRGLNLEFDFSSNRLTALTYFTDPFLSSQSLLQPLPLSLLSQKSKNEIIQRFAERIQTNSQELETLAESLGLSPEEVQQVLRGEMRKMTADDKKIGEKAEAKLRSEDMRAREKTFRAAVKNRLEQLDIYADEDPETAPISRLLPFLEGDTEFFPGQPRVVSDRGIQAAIREFMPDYAHQRMLQFLVNFRSMTLNGLEKNESSPAYRGVNSQLNGFKRSTVELADAIKAGTFQARFVEGREKRTVTLGSYIRFHSKANPANANVVQIALRRYRQLRELSKTLGAERLTGEAELERREAIKALMNEFETVVDVIRAANSPYARDRYSSSTMIQTIADKAFLDLDDLRFKYRDEMREGRAEARSENRLAMTPARSEMLRQAAVAVAEQKAMTPAQASEAKVTFESEGAVKFTEIMREAITLHIQNMRAQGVPEASVADWQASMNMLLDWVSPKEGEAETKVKLVIGFILGSKMESTFKKTLLQVLAANSGVGGIIFNGQMTDADLLAQLKEQGVIPRPVRNMRQPVQDVDQFGIPTAVMDSGAFNMAALNDLFIPFQTDLSEMENDPMGRDFVMMLQMTALVRTAQLLAGTKLTKKQIQAALIKQLGEILQPQDVISLNDQGLFVINGKNAWAQAIQVAQQARQKAAAAA